MQKIMKTNDPNNECRVCGFCGNELDTTDMIFSCAVCLKELCSGCQCEHSETGEVVCADHIDAILEE